ncbi:hypothetical protein LTR36_000630 [Oleoguttula mirabilis]|uniref:BTB domain-containing protein n=1 Tax=Oleoguttula mirabilis TaxID=1507867 RepID=A0AAV9JQG8_9PEZI|nr:hypothetical protein LTR36_000630 [Oleoguttula mirabilis]
MDEPLRRIYTQGDMNPDPFHWQIPTRTGPSQTEPAKGPVSPRTWTELNNVLRANEWRNFDICATVAESTHTEFQEHRDDDFASAPSVEEYDPPPSAGDRGYMQRSSSSSLCAAPINDKSFMEWYAKGDAILSFPGDNGQIACISNVNPWIIEERCPLLSTAFEPSRSGPQLYLETLTSATATPFLRYLYTGTYALTSTAGDYYEDVPTSVLLHCQLFRLGDLYDLLELKTQAYVNVLRQCEFGCSSPGKPIDLCAAIRYIYEYLREHDNVTDAILNYCVSCFLTHRLAHDKEFKQLAFELRPFHQDLCRTTMKREFEDETATAIIQMPFKPFIPATYASREEPGNTRLEDVIYHFHACEDADSARKKRQLTEPVPPPTRISNPTLALRPRLSDPQAVKEDSGSEDEGFQLVRRASSGAGSTDPFSDPEFEILPKTLPVEAISPDDESDTDTVVEVPRSGPSVSNAARALPMRTRGETGSAAAAASDNDSDSDWSMV